MKKGFFTLLMALLAFAELIHAQSTTTKKGTRDVEIEIGSDETASWNYYPTFAFYNYSYTQQIYTAAEIGQAGTIYAISFKYATTYAAFERDLTIYMKNVTRDNFGHEYDYEPMTAENEVYMGTVIAAEAGWLTITLQTPFEYDGTSNLLIGVDDNTGAYESNKFFWCFNDSDNMSIRAYNDTDNPNPLDIESWNQTTHYQDKMRNHVKLSMTDGEAPLYPAPKDLYGEYTWLDDGTYGTTLRWHYDGSGAVNEWLHYDDGQNVTAFGASELRWGIMFPAATLQAYQGCSLTEVALVECEESGTYTLKIYYGETPSQGVLIHTQDFTTTGTNDWKTIPLTTPLPIEATQNLWVTFYQKDITYPGTCCNNTGDPNGRWISLDGTEWTDLLNYGLNYTWLIRAFVTNTAKDGETTELSNLKVTDKQTIPIRTNPTPDHYNIYRSTTQGNYSPIAEVPASATTYFDDLTGNAGTYYYQVTAVYVEGTEEHESVPALAYASSNNYAMIEVTDVEDHGNAALYPNPTSGNVTINAQNMNRITVVSVLGQVVYDAEVEGNEYVLDMAQFNAGVYMVRIATENGISTKRVSIAK